jgi:hypothetical protein
LLIITKREVIDGYAYGYVLSLKHNGLALPDNVDNEKSVITYDGVLEHALKIDPKLQTAINALKKIKRK